MARRDDKLTTDDLASAREGGSARSEAAASETTVSRELHDEPARGETGVEDEGTIGSESAVGERGSDVRRSSGAVPETEPLLAADQANEFRASWETIQASFVDEPRRSVEQADALVADLMQRLANVFSDERRSLESQWDRGEDVSTEDLRVALQRYRSFFDRLLST